MTDYSGKHKTTTELHQSNETEIYMERDQEEQQEGSEV